MRMSMIGFFGRCRAQNYSTGGVPSFHESVMRLRVILDTEDDVFRDIEIETTAPLMHLHFAVLDATGWESGELASFFQSDEAWSRGKEFSLLDMSDPMAEDGAKPEDAMNTSTVGHLIPGLGQRAIYVYDFLRMWCFYVEPLALEDAKPDNAYPARAVPRIWHPSCF